MSVCNEWGSAPAIFDVRSLVLMHIPSRFDDGS